TSQAELVDKYSYPEARIKETLELAGKQCGSEHPAVAGYLEELAALLRKMNRVAEAKKTEQRANKIRAKNLQTPPPKPCGVKPTGQW
ncbi:MAG: tetratricopeptide repeat protein, partial [Acidobacteria bacterium]|nr:tetratricopeptide repeat protein [Acidobacteriota bacterium]